MLHLLTLEMPLRLCLLPMISSPTRKKVASTREQNVDPATREHALCEGQFIWRYGPSNYGPKTKGFRSSEKECRQRPGSFIEPRFFSSGKPKEQLPQMDCCDN